MARICFANCGFSQCGKGAIISGGKLIAVKMRFMNTGIRSSMVHRTAVAAPRRLQHRVCRLALVLLALAAGALSSPSVFAAPPSEPWPVALRVQMAKLTTVGYRLNLAAVDLCSSKAAGTGMSLDYIGAYSESDRPAVSQLLSMNDKPQIAAVVKGGPADLAGVRVGDELLAVNGETAGAIIAASPDAALIADEIEQRLAQQPVAKVIQLGLRRDGNAFEVHIQPQLTCAARFVIKTGEGITAFSDGSNVAISSKLIAFAVNDDELALVAGHELGHVINHDGTAGSLAERRRMEDRADSVGLRLATCAGFDPSTGLEFWLRRDEQDMLRLFRDRSHRSRKARVQLMRDEIPNIQCPYRP